MATRKTFNDDDESIADAIPHQRVARYQCAAHQCPMPGTLSGEGAHGVCAYHYAANSLDWPRITQALLDWQIVTDEINRCRKVLTDHGTATNPGVIDAEFRLAWGRVERGAGHWVADLKPQLTKVGKMDSYGTWGLRLEQFMGQRVVESLRHRVGRKAA